jgi:hypothetical protein
MTLIEYSIGQEAGRTSDRTAGKHEEHNANDRVRSERKEPLTGWQQTLRSSMARFCSCGVFFVDAPPSSAPICSKPKTQHEPQRHPKNNNLILAHLCTK